MAGAVGRERRRSMNLILLGAPGAGKGTQAEILCDRLNIPTISTGNMIREALKSGTEMGKKAQSYIESGALVPDEVVIGIVRDRLAQDDCKNGFILDGFPRTIPQAEALKAMLAERGHKVAAMIELDVPEEELMKRLIKRGQESGRSDDNAETIKKRLDVYHNQTAPLIEWYSKEGIHHHINGLGELNRIFGDICTVIDSL